ncbi:MAG: hypothetical protein JSS83_08435 [Cyanobacteria bacterium SZAS LIN-3]|nr:hypothetical protein [Cyanobacteria bacterium SZAS LIN-3]MBS2008692.1 hypothetical protein [Cyanobacteria bacterium SZAS TMP-1]
MATLKSEDPEFQSAITIKPGKMLEIKAMSTLTKEKEDQLWQLLDLEVTSGKRTLSFTTADGQDELESVTHAVENISAIAHAYLFCRKPSDEPRNLVKMLEEVISGKRPKLLFEPAEPSFEMTINAVGGGLRVELFVDAGNVETGIYRWDSLGIRFFTTAANLQSFVDELKAEFNC